MGWTLVSETQRSQIDRHLHRVIDRLLSAEGLESMTGMIRSWVLAGGKRIRPQLCIWTFQHSLPTATGGGATAVAQAALAGDELPALLLDAACAWELFHAFLLTHDDIIDSALTRRQQGALHRQLAALDHNCPKFGTNLGIVAGDLLFSAAVRLWHELDAPADQYRDLLKLFSRVATVTGFGQAIDICQSHAPLEAVDEQTLLREYLWKTAAYTFEGPMLSGAILAGVDEEARSAISSFALALGQAYQLQNDLLDLRSQVHEGCDLLQGKRTVALISARLQMDDERRRKLDCDLAALQRDPPGAVALADRIRHELLAAGAEVQARAKIAHFLTAAVEAARSKRLPESLRGAMGELLKSLSTGYFELTQA
ncbi:MAG: polyprenyl synthetase family protein [Phycisphaerales bacterium]|nr:polyprenyl synthetase family protein [Phycisphaerales bacterium]